MLTYSDGAVNNFLEHMMKMIFAVAAVALIIYLFAFGLTILAATPFVLL